MALIAEYGFNEGTGTTAADSSGNGYGLTVASSLWAPGHTGSGVIPTGTSPTARALGTGTLTAMTVMAWVKTPASWPESGADLNIVSDDTGEWYCTITQSGKPATWMQTGGRIASNALTTNAWHHLAYVISGTSNTLYVDGTAVGTSMNGGSATALAALRADPWYIATAFGDETSSAITQRTIDDVRIFNTALSASDIATYMNTPVAPAVTGAIAATTPTVAAGVATATMTGTVTAPAYTGALDATTPTVTVEVATSALTGTVTVPVYTGSLDATGPGVQADVASAAWTGVVTAPTFTGSLDATSPEVSIGVATSDLTGTYTPPGAIAGAIDTTTPQVGVEVAEAAWTGIVTAPTYTGTLDAATPTVVAHVAQAEISGTYTPPEALTGSLDAQTPTVAVTVAQAAWQGTYTPGGDWRDITVRVSGPFGRDLRIGRPTGRQLSITGPRRDQ
ncbi:hypothetical protein GCM10025864_39790 [Luteimicrobium album]|uniref:LamG-like jellyroll fold domain-containing protein n=2 Tax=Luteimicrobium album TaxID=1054550 RepID=A0ABQ6I911_9MICO|nr:hypothetical protein GCM10025864_39790 [Luteimicrobium album]